MGPTIYTPLLNVVACLGKRIEPRARFPLRETFRPSSCWGRRNRNDPCGSAGSQRLAVSEGVDRTAAVRQSGSSPAPDPMLSATCQTDPALPGSFGAATPAPEASPGRSHD